MTTSPRPSQLYQDVVIEHNRSPRNFRIVEPCSHHGRGHNPVCGDTVELYLRLDEDDCIADVSFQGDSCAIATASASLLTEAVRRRSMNDALALAADVEALIEAGSVGEHLSHMDALRVLENVRQFPGRQGCARLAWSTLRELLQGR